MNEKQQIDPETREKYAWPSHPNKKTVDPNWTMSDPMNEIGLGTASLERKQHENQTTQNL